MKKRIFIYIALFLNINAFSQPKGTLYFVSGTPFTFQEEVPQRPVLFRYNQDTMSLDTILQLSPQEPFMNIDFIGLYNSFGYLVILKSDWSTAENQILSILDLNTLHKNSVVIERGVTSESNLFFISPDSIYYCVRLIETNRERGFNKRMETRDFPPPYFNYVYIQGNVGTAIGGNREFLVLYNESTNNNALHISKGSGWGLTVGPYLNLQPPKELYNAFPPVLKSMRVNDSHSMIISYDFSKPDSSRIGEGFRIIYDRLSGEWYQHTFRGNASSVRSFDNGWVAGTIRDIDRGRLFDWSTMQFGDEFDFQRESPGYEERVPRFYKRTDGIWGDSFDDRKQFFGHYYPGLLFLFNVHTRDYIEWDTKQGDSAVLLVQDGYVYYRVNTRILRSAIIDNKRLSEPKLLIDDERVRDIHWAYLKRGE